MIKVSNYQIIANSKERQGKWLYKYLNKTQYHVGITNILSSNNQQADIQEILLTYEYVIFSFHNHYFKIDDFYLLAYFWASELYFVHQSLCNQLS